MRKTKPIKIRIKDIIEVYPEGVYMSKVVKSGNGAMIKFFKKYLGKDVVVIVKDEIKEADNLFSTDLETLENESGRDKSL